MSAQACESVDADRVLEMVRTIATEEELDPDLALAVVDVESAGGKHQVSDAGAVGIMQLMPATARWVAKQMNQGDYRPARIGEAQLNTQFGAFYFKYWLDRLDGMPALAAAAYNAGPGRARAWRADVPLEGAIYAESIPFNETRDYVKKVLANAVWYAHLRGSGNTSLKARLGIIPARER